MGAKLVAEEGLLKGLTLSFEEGDEWVVGRDPDACQLLIEDPSASRRHFVCRITSEGIIAENLSETNPLKINQKEIPEPTLLHHGDMLQVGEGLYRFYASDSPVIEGLKTSPSDSEDEEHETPSLFEDQSDASAEEPLAEVSFDLTDTAPWMLKVVAGPNNGAQFSMMSDSSYLIGTDPSSCDIVFHDVSVSRQHARLTISKDNVITLEDLGSSNGTLADSQSVKGKVTIAPNTLISTGTTSFVIFDREGQRQTIISPLLPAIVKLLQDEQKKKEEVTTPPPEVSIQTPPPVEELVPKEPAPEPHSQIGALVLIAVLSGIFLFVGMGAIFLFKQEKIEQKSYDIDKELSTIISLHPSVRYSFNPTSGRLVLIGHVLTSVEREQLLHDLGVFPFISHVDSNIVVDENIWQETNQVMAKNPNWKGVSIHSPVAGRFVITGYVSTRKQAEALSEYLSQNFPYIDLLEQKFIIEEDILNKIDVLLKEKGFSVVTSKFNNGEIVLTGDIPYGERPTINGIANNIKKVEGVRDVKVYVTELPPSDTLVNITSQYRVTGSLAQGNGKISVVINGQIYSEGDSLDGKQITKISDSMVMLESGGIKYRIDYSQ